MIKREVKGINNNKQVILSMLTLFEVVDEEIIFVKSNYLLLFSKHKFHGYLFL